MEVSMEKILDFDASILISGQRTQNLFDLFFGTINTILQLEYIEVLIGCQLAFSLVVEFVATPGNLVDQRFFFFVTLIQSRKNLANCRGA